MNIGKEIRNRLSNYEKLGVEKQSNGTELIGKAPHIAPLAYLHSIYKGLNKEEIDRLERELETEIPTDYKKFLQFSNGLHIFNTTFCLDGLRTSYNRIKEIENGISDPDDNVLKNAPHIAKNVMSDEWTHKYSRKKAAYPLEWLESNKFWPTVKRVDNAYGDRNLICSCPSPEEYAIPA